MSTTRLVRVAGAIRSSEQIKRSGSYEVAQTRIVIVVKLPLMLCNVEAKVILRMTSRDGGDLKALGLSP